MTLSLRIVDQADNTGATATIAGSDPAATNQVYVWAWRIGVMLGEWTLAGTRTGDGTVDLVLRKGVYFSYLKSTAGAVQSVVAPVTFGVSDGAEALHYRILYAVRDVVLALNLATITDERVKVLKRPVRVQDYIGSHGIIVSPQAETLQPHDNAREEWGPAVQVVMFRKDNQRISDDVGDSSQPLAIDLNWRYRLMFALTETGLPGVSEVSRVACFPGPLLLPEALGAQYDAQGLVFRFQLFEEHTVYP